MTARFDTRRWTSSSCSSKLLGEWYMLSMRSAMGVTTLSRRDIDLLRNVNQATQRFMVPVPLQRLR